MQLDRDAFLPFGAQYYRAPTPPPECWEPDLDRLAAAGFNTIKIWVQWRTNEPREGEYDFADVVGLMRLADERGVAVVPNIICDIAPAWFYRKYPDCHVVTNDGRVLEPCAPPHRQAGGAPGPSLLHGPGREARRAFCAAAAEALAPFGNLLAWDLWNEPQLICMGVPGGLTDAMVDYSAHARNAFSQWVRRKYNNLEALNTHWGRNYQSWDEVEVPRMGDCFGDMIDWRCFFVDVVAEELVLRREGVRAADGGNPVMTHTVPWPHFSLVRDGVDEARLAAECDWFGNSVGTEPYAARCTVSAAPGKRCIASEIHAIHGLTYDRPPRPDFDGMKRHLLSPLSHGVTGFLFWQYRPESIGRESPAWGLADGEGGETPWMAHTRRVNDVLQENRAELLACRRAPADVLVVKGAKNEVFDFCAAGNPEMFHRSVQGTFLALHDRQFQADIATTGQLGELDLSGVRVIYYPFPYLVERETADILRAWVAAGGTLVSEAFFGAFLDDVNRHAPSTPGYGFAEVFGAREGRVLTVKHIPAESSLRPAGGEAGDVLLRLGDDLARAVGSPDARGLQFSEALEPRGADVLAWFGDGEPAITESRWGKGRAIWIGTLLGHRHTDHGDDRAADVIAALARRGGARRPVRSSSTAVRADLLAPPGGGTAFLVLGNRGSTHAVSIEVDGRWSRAENLLGQGNVRLATGPGQAAVETTVGAGAWELFRLSP